MALLVDSGLNIVTALELLEEQTTKKKDPPIADRSILSRPDFDASAANYTASNHRGFAILIFG